MVSGVPDPPAVRLRTQPADVKAGMISIRGDEEMSPEEVLAEYQEGQAQ